MTRVAVQPALLQWACERSGRDIPALTKKFPKLEEWQRSQRQPTFKQLEDFARATYTPIGFFFLQQPPQEPMPIPDFRTLESTALRTPSPHLLDTIYLCQQRQDWYKQYALLIGEAPRRFIGSATTESDVVATAARIRQALKLTSATRSAARDIDEAVRIILDCADDAGILAMISGYVGSNTSRILDTDEFRGFALADSHAPLIFVNGTDTKAGQMFTLAHELAHLWLGESGVSDNTSASTPRASVERWCNAVAAETLVPLEEFKLALRPTAELWAETRRLAVQFRISTLVVLRRMKDARRLTAAEHSQAFAKESAHLRQIMLAKKAKQSSGNFYATASYRLSPRFAGAVIASTYEGRSSFTEAFRMLGCRSKRTMDNLADNLGLGNPSWEGGKP